MELSLLWSLERGLDTFHYSWDELCSRFESSSVQLYVHFVVLKVLLVV